ncbi:S9 family peptidase [Alkalihalobacillus sp. LMS6]|uniref:S9 family peptidase n=1 Tax=Bacillaceae TaxID=186817 RepID=UPI000C08BC61|nr:MULTISPECIES: S9 family peptidase [Bacillaceae]UTR07281.1 S9 family peptidase [Alkalihalobacillus sp. LMS6]
MVTFTKPDVRAFLKTVKVTQFTVSPDGKTIAFQADFTGVPEIWAMDVEVGFPYQLTSVGQKAYDLRFSTDGTFMIVSFDHDGNEKAQLYGLSVEGGELTPIRTKENTHYNVCAQSKTGQQLYYTSDQDNKTYFNLYTYHFETEEESMVLEGEGARLSFSALSKDEQSFTYAKFYGNTSSVGYLYRNGTSEPLIPDADREHVTSDSVIVKDGTVYFTTNVNQEFSFLARYHPDTKTFEELLTINGEAITSLTLTEDETLIYLITTAGVLDKCYLYRLDTGTYEELALPITSVEQVELTTSGALVVLGSKPTRPSNIYMYHEKEWSQLTDVRVTGIHEQELSEPDVIRYSSYDGLEIEALLYKPQPDKANGYTVLMPHGGPQWADLLEYDANSQILVYEGYQVFMPNYRGSTRYGASFTKMVEGDWGEGPRSDILEGLDVLTAQKKMDPEKLVVLGGSYGGYMTLLLHGRHPERFKAAVDICGVSNLFSFVETVPESWKPVMDRWVGNPEKDKERLIKDSPITYLESMTKPMLVIQGANDPRVVKEESDQIVDALRKQGTDIDYLVFEDEGHGFTKVENRITMFETIIRFLNRHLPV